jgi:hypothetical protein
VTLVWSDPPAPVNNSGLDDATPTLQNDLDVELIPPGDGGVAIHPYTLVRANPGAQATQSGPNRVDNVEVIDAAPQVGKWTVRVKAHRLAAGARQPFALVVSGLHKTD